jgi:hypothetical protein
MQPHQQRVIAEKLELDERLSKLSAFLTSPKADELSVEEWCHMKEQQFYMRGYAKVLAARILLFPAINEAETTTTRFVHNYNTRETIKVGTGDSTRPNC